MMYIKQFDLLVDLIHPSSFHIVHTARPVILRNLMLIAFSKVVDKLTSSLHALSHEILIACCIQSCLVVPVDSIVEDLQQLVIQEPMMRTVSLVGLEALPCFAERLTRELLEISKPRF